MTRLLRTLLVSLLLLAPASAQEAAVKRRKLIVRRRAVRRPWKIFLPANGAKQLTIAIGRRGESDGESAPGLGPLGPISDSEVWRDLRFNEANVKVSAGGEEAKVLVQDGGMAWLQFRQGPLITYGGWGLVATLGLVGAVLPFPWPHHD